MRFYRPELDVLRFIAFLMVFTVHVSPDPSAWEGVPFGDVLRGATAAGAYGVDLFFCLSAYLITNLLLREQQTRGQIDVWRFYGRRALRIWPLYFVFLGITPMLALLLPGEELPPQYLAAFLLFLGNWACALWGFPPSVASPLWSVSIEEQFYLAWPFVLRHFRLTVPLVLGLLVASSSIQLAGLSLHLPEQTSLWCNTLARLQPIAVGAWLATVDLPSLSSIQRIGLASLSITLFLLVGSYGGTYGPESLWTYPTVAIASGLLLLATFGAKIAWSPLVYLGKISYGLYVFHAVVIAFVLRQHIVSTVTEYALRSLVALLLTVAVAALSYQFLERPFLRLKDRFAVIQSRPA